MNWRNLTASPDGTHHLAEDRAAYGPRFDEVLKFHAPGLAPVRREERAWHIRADGSDAYARRFARTFGFYEDRAAVMGHEGWHHIAPDGADAYAARFAWCGNFQSARSPVRASDGRYHHIAPDGASAYAARWRYAGDYRDGVAVVKRDDGLATHIDLDGHPVHGRWFVDLDVFHKGHARARDREGWFHVDGRGEAIYEQRFGTVEPFYNGQALVERHDGAQSVIGHDGRSITEVCASWLGGRTIAEPHRGPRLLLLGLRSSGKTTAGQALALRHRIPFVSLDACRRRWGDGSVAGDQLARAMFLRACGTFHAGVFETSGAGPYRFATRAALLECAAPLVVCWLDAPAAVRQARLRTPADAVPDPLHAQGSWSDEVAESTLRDDTASGWWATGEGWRAHRIDADRAPELVSADIDARLPWETDQ